MHANWNADYDSSESLCRILGCMDNPTCIYTQRNSMLMLYMSSAALPTKSSTQTTCQPWPKKEASRCYLSFSPWFAINQL